MPQIDRRALLAALGAMALPPALARAAAIDADVRTGTIKDVEHVVILMQENRSFDHYFRDPGRGAGFRRPLPGAGARTPGPARARTARSSPRPTRTSCWPRSRWRPPRPSPTCGSRKHAAQLDQRPGRLGPGSHGPLAGVQAALVDGLFRAGRHPFQFALAETFTVCDAYHCSTRDGDQHQPPVPVDRDQRPGRNARRPVDLELARQLRRAGRGGRSPTAGPPIPSGC
ncbi:alkaline phosphatase family protein [Caulobacter segnis]